MANGLHIILGDPQVQVACSSTSSAASPPATRSPTASSARSRTLGDEATKPLVVRLDGNNVEEGRRILAEANHPLVTVEVDTMDGAAPQAAELAGRDALSKGRAHSMAIFLNENSKVIVQGMTGSEGMKHTQRMLASGTDIVGGVNPRKAGTTVDFDGGVTVPVFGTVAEAMRRPAPTCRSSSCRRPSPRPP